MWGLLADIGEEMPISSAYFRKIQDFDPVLRDALLGLAEEMERSRQESVTRDEFRELRDIVRELAEAQKRTEARVEELAEAQKRTEARVEELAEAQKGTEKALALLTGEHHKTRQELGGLSATVGYRLEDEAFKGLPALLKRDLGLELDAPLRRRFMPDKQGRLVEVNIIGSGTRDGKPVTVLGEAKSQLSKRMVNEFLRKRLARFQGVFQEILPVLVTYMISEPDAEEYARQKGVAVYYSYDL